MSDKSSKTVGDPSSSEAVEVLAFPGSFAAFVTDMQKLNAQKPQPVLKPVPSK